ncbi:hypothetical protein JZ751_020442 [Albula glossodonta]|uniref:Uncharacterized protein n=1 Tax=Albula glossodonta TaxID=121402 RepID=A0A8T2N372_9TELE|nr:hypothetical protein JZ751_020442 [Albula glossodonta]
MTTGMNQMSLQGGHGATTPGPGQQCSSPMSQPSMVMPHHHQHQQAQPMGSSPPLSQQGLQQQGTQAGLMSLPNPLTTQQQHQQKMRLQRIQLERERIRMRQEELMRQEVALCRQMPLDSNSMALAPTPISAAPLSQGNMPNPSTDPFLNRYCTPLSLNHPRVCPHILQHCLLSQIRVHIH